MDQIIDILGLRECVNTNVGNEEFRGVSGGQKRRLTIAESLLSKSRVFCMDEITNGIDSAVALSIIQFIQKLCVRTKSTFITALNAPTPEIFHSFDNLILLSEGYVLYHGPVNQIETYLAKLQYHKPNFQDLGDYLTHFLISPAMCAELALVHQEDKTKVPTLQTIPELASYWTQSPEYQALMNDGTTVVARSKTENSPLLLTPYTVQQYAPQSFNGSTFIKQFKLLLGRQIKLIKRNPPLGFAKLSQGLVMGLIIGSLYYKPDPAAFPLRFALALFAAIFLAFGNMAEIPAVDVSKRIVYRQTSSNLYEPLPYLSSILVTHFPFTVAANIIFSSLLYYFSGYVDNVGRFFFFYLTLLSHELALSAMFRTFAYIAPSMELGQALAGAFTGIFLVFGGFLIAYPSIPKYAWPLFYISPFSWTVRSIAINEFEDDSYKVPVAPFPNAPLKGDVYMSSFGFAGADVNFFTTEWKWGGIALLLSYWLLFGLFVCNIVLKMVRYEYVPGTQRLAITNSVKQSTTSATGSVRPTSSAATANKSTNSILPVGENVTVEGSSTPLPSMGQLINHTSHNQTDGNTTDVIVPMHVNPMASIANNPNLQSKMNDALLLPCLPVTLTFQNIYYDVNVPKATQPLRLLNNIHGIATPGNLIALMGASGAGKTTLLDVLAFRKTTGTIQGDIRLNGMKVTADEFARVSAYCEQQDIHEPFSTVEEALTFSARLRLARSITPIERSKFIKALLDVLELTPLAHRIVATLSPGERKRLTIGVELASNPSLLFADEPTTGLDARAAAIVMRVLRNIAAAGRTVICTIHQPSAEVFLAFDSLLLLAPGGKQIYLGPLGYEGNDIIKYFNTYLPDIKISSENINPATWMLQVLEDTSAALKSNNAGKDTIQPNSTDENAQSSSSSTPSLSIFDTLYPSSPYYTTNKTNIDTYIQNIETDETMKVSLAKSLQKVTPTFGSQFLIVLERSWKTSWRNPSYNALRVGNIMVLAILFGIVYLHIDDTTQQGLQSKIAAIFNNAGFVGVLCFTTSLPNYAKERIIFYREKFSRMYAPEAYSLAIGLVEIPWVVLLCTISMLVTYWSIGFRGTPEAFFTMFLGFVSLGTNWVWIGQWFAAFFPNVRIAQILGGIQITLTFLFGGVFIPVVEIVKGWKGFYYVVSTAHALRLMTLPQFYCTPEEIQTHQCKEVQAVINGVPTTIDQYTFVKDYRLGMAYEDRFEAFGWIVCIGMIFRLFTMFSYRFINHVKR